MDIHNHRASLIKKRLAASIWDLDGLIVDTIPIHHESWKETLKKVGLKYEDAVIRSVSGCCNWEIGKAFLQWQNYSADDEFLSRIVEMKQTIFWEHLNKGVVVHPGVINWVEYFFALGIPQAIASSSSLYIIDRLLDLTGLKKYFQVIISGEAEVKQSKPAPDIFLLAARKLRADPALSIVLEDASVGVTAAKSAGMYCIAVTNTQLAEELKGADLVVNALSDISPWEFLKYWSNI